MFTLPCSSICAGLIQIRNRSEKMLSKISSIVSGIARWLSVRNCPSVSVGSAATSMPDSGVESTASSGAWVLRARCAASAPNAVTELTRTSPRSSRAMHVMISSSIVCCDIVGLLHAQALAEHVLAAEALRVLAVVDEHVLLEVLVPRRPLPRRGEVLAHVVEVRAVVWRAPREVGAPFRLYDAGHDGAEDVNVPAVGLQALGQQDLLGRQERQRRGLRAQGVHVAVPEDDAVALGVGEVDVEQGDVGTQRRHGDEGLAAERILEGLEGVVHFEEVGPE